MFRPVTGGSGTPPEATRKAFWFAFLAAVAIYGVVGYIVSPKVPEPVPGWLGAGAGAVFVGLSLLLPRLMAGAGGAAVSTAEFVQWASDESVAVVGLVMRMLGRPWNELLAYLAVSALLLWLHRPRS
jgi:hypothetical protein